MLPPNLNFQNVDSITDGCWMGFFLFSQKNTMSISFPKNYLKCRLARPQRTFAVNFCLSSSRMSSGSENVSGRMVFWTWTCWWTVFIDDVLTIVMLVLNSAASEKWCVWSLADSCPASRPVMWLVVCPYNDFEYRIWMNRGYEWLCGDLLSYPFMVMSPVINKQVYMTLKKPD